MAAAVPYKGLAPFEADDTTTSSGASVSSPTSWRGSSAARCSPSSARPERQVVGGRAGLLPALRHGRSARQRPMGARGHPARRSTRWVSCAAHSPARGASRGARPVDQFEEVFTACADEEERARFAAELVRAIRGAEGTMLVVLALRADFYGAVARIPSSRPSWPPTTSS
jgi:hypothetical protein